MAQVKSIRRVIFFGNRNHEDWNNFWISDVKRLFLNPYMNPEKFEDGVNFGCLYLTRKNTLCRNAASA